MSERKRGLGRGLEALLGQAAPRVEPEPAAGREALARIPVGQLERGRYQPRLDLREESLAELADSIRAQGLMQPIIVRPLGLPPPGAAQRYEIIAGERRWRAAQQAGLTEVPAIVREVDDEAAVAMALIENIQRENLNPLEEARALERLTGEFGLTHQEAAEAVGRSRATVSNLLRLLELPEEVRSLVEQRQIEMGHARALLALAHKRQQTEVGALVAKKGLSVRETEALVRRLVARGESGAGPAPARETDPDIRRLQDDLADRLGATVELHHAASGRGRLVIRYHSLDELDGILTRIR
ncbi:MAG: ParB/RepB/Spo0J family partition protein [Gammaproteobacteria bacterium]|nr:ParB/RepB/Spo0J family partition protein [Gammaproteobacteria bacterium]